MKKQLVCILVMIIGAVVLCAGSIWNQVVVYQKSGLIFANAFVWHIPSIAMVFVGFITLLTPLLFISLRRKINIKITNKNNKEK